MLLFMIPLTTSSAHHHTTKDAKHEKIKKDDGDTQDDKVVKTTREAEQIKRRSPILSKERTPRLIYLFLY